MFYWQDLLIEMLFSQKPYLVLYDFPIYIMHILQKACSFFYKVIILFDVASFLYCIVQSVMFNFQKQVTIEYILLWYIS